MEQNLRPKYAKMQTDPRRTRGSQNDQNGMPWLQELSRIWGKQGRKTRPQTISGDRSSEQVECETSKLNKQKVHEIRDERYEMHEEDEENEDGEK